MKQKIMGFLLVGIISVSMFQGICVNAEEDEDISMNKKLTVQVGGTKTLAVLGTKKTVKWSSSNKKVAKITKRGKNKLNVRGKDDGKTVIAASVGDRKITCNVTVKKKEIRVLLRSSYSSGITHNKVTITSSNRFTISNGEKTKTYPAKKKVTITAANKLLKDASALTVQAENGGRIRVTSLRKIQGNPSYRGSLVLRKSGKSLTVVNNLPLEEYLYSVVSSEMSTSSSLEALKAQAITARSFAYAHLDNGKYKKYKADMDDSSVFQVYNNIAETDKTRRAVRETENLVLKDGDKIVSTYYFSTSFGQTTTPSEVWGGSATEKYYKSILQTKGGKQKNLSSSSAFESFINSNSTTFDSKSDWYRWYFTMSKSEMQKYVNGKIASWYASYPSYVKTKQKNGSYKSQKISSVGKLKNISVVEREKSGMVVTLQITGSKKTVRIYGGERLRYILSPGSNKIVKKGGSTISGMSMLPSSFFYVKKGEKGYTIRGGGFGHGVGMSQSGANQMGRQGYNYKKILHHYFKNVSIKKVVG